jgi:hypothetical protein
MGVPQISGQREDLAWRKRWKSDGISRYWTARAAKSKSPGRCRHSLRSSGYDTRTSQRPQTAMGKVLRER